MKSPHKTKLVCIVALLMLVTLLIGAAPAESVRAASAQAKLSDFVIVYPQGSTQTSYAYHAAILLQDMLFEKTGMKLEVHDDGHASAEHRILVGVVQNIGISYQTAQSDEFFISVSDRQILLSGENHMLGAAVHVFTSRCVQPDGSITPDIYRTPGRKEFYAHSDQARRVVYLIADGAGPTHYSWYNQSVSPAHFSGDDLPVHGMLKTDKYSGGTTDSAAAATALACGFKTAKGVVGMDSEKTVRYRNIRELLQAHGWRTAVMTTDEITGATPAGFTAHTDSRGNESEISQQQAQLIADGAITALEGSLDDESALPTVAEYLRQYHAADGVFLMYEEAYIDKNSHDMDGETMLHAVSRFDAVVSYCMVAAAADPDTLLIVTSDHETGGVQYDAQSGYFFTESGHTSTDVRIMAMGPGTEYFNGQTFENTSVPSFLADTVAQEKLGDETTYTPPENHTHSLIPYSEVAATSQFTGQRAFYRCTTCSKCFADETATQELSQDDLLLPIIEAFPFSDVQQDDYYYGAVRWAVQTGITQGTSDKAFSPDETCTRAQMVSFLWRAAGKPKPVVDTCKFADVKDDAYYYDAVLWAVEKGITNGTSAETFSPNETVCRAQAVTFLWRVKSCPESGAACAFADVTNENTYYYPAVVWASANGITQGTSDRTFSPDAPCTRAQVVTFLYRCFH